MRPPCLRSAAVAASMTCLLLALPALAGASKYPPDPAARGFNGGVAGWQGSTGFDGSCLAGQAVATVFKNRKLIRHP